MSENVLEVKNLCKYFDVNRGMKGAQKVIAVDGISFEVKKGETFRTGRRIRLWKKYTGPHDFTDL
mgnify:CR=1 FL=1